MDKTPEQKQVKKPPKRQKLKKQIKIKLTKVTLLAGFLTGILVCLCWYLKLLKFACKQI